jgi:HEPN/RES N-terminal domain 1/RES domain
MPSDSSDDYVCGNCFADDGIKGLIESTAESDVCTFCGATSETPIAAPIEIVTEHIASCIGQYYDDPANTLPYETAEGGYQGVTYTTDELLDEVGLDFPRDNDGRLREAVCAAFDNDLWSDADPFALSRSEQLRFSWEEFCRVIKHERRYFFAQEKRSKDSELYSPAEILKLIFAYAEEAGAFVVLPRSTRLYRARFQPKGKHFTTAGSLGPPPLENAVQTNRMSPPGVVMTYASEDKVTALAETANEPGEYAVGEFKTERDALILDLTRLPSVPSIFEELPDSLEYDPRPRLGFLHSISREISRPIAHDDRIHIEYVPTQVVTEYVRTAVQINKRPVDGIRYRSSRRKTHTALVLFADQKNLVLDKTEQPDFYSLWTDRWLALSCSTVDTLTTRDIKTWAR